MLLLFFFFFQAEDGIRDLTVTGVQTCALPISARKMPCRVTHLERVTPDVVIVTLQLPASERLKYQAGQFLEFTLGNGARRSPGALFGAATKAIQEARHPPLEGPLGTFFLRQDSERPIVLLASGTGF